MAMVSKYHHFYQLAFTNVHKRLSHN